jgi:hypothetical protein
VVNLIDFLKNSLEAVRKAKKSKITMAKRFRFSKKTSKNNAY